MCPPQVDNKGNHLLVHEESSINVPAIAAAHVIKRYIAQASDELSFEVTHPRLGFHCRPTLVSLIFYCSFFDADQKLPVWESILTKPMSFSCFKRAR